MGARRAWGSIAKRKTRTGYWLRYTDRAGARHCLFAGETRTDAETFAADMRRRETRPARETTLAEFLADTYLELRRGLVAPKVWVTQNGALLKAAEHFGGKAMSDVTAADAESYLAALPHEPGTVIRYRSNLSTCWKAAIARGAAHENPWPSVRLKHAQETAVRFLSQDDLDRLYAATPEKYRTLVVCLGESGLRLGEALRLHGRDVVDGCLVVAQSKNRGTRTVPMTSRLARIIPAVVGDRLVFEDIPKGREGELAASGRAVWKATTEGCGLDHLRLHDLRHARASLLVRAGVPVPTVARWLGHANGQLVLRRYGHHAPADALAQALASLERVAAPEPTAGKGGGRRRAPKADRPSA